MINLLNHSRSECQSLIRPLCSFPKILDPRDFADSPIKSIESLSGAMELQLLDCSLLPSTDGQAVKQSSPEAYIGTWPHSMGQSSSNISDDLATHTDSQQTDQRNYHFVESEPFGTVHHPQAGQRLDAELECQRRLSLPVQHPLEGDSSKPPKKHGSDPGS